MTRQTAATPEAAEPARTAVRDAAMAPEGRMTGRLIEAPPLDAAARGRASARAADLVARVRQETSPSLMESFLAEYGLSTSEGVGLMCLAEALLRVPDTETIDELIHDKIEPSDWGAHLGRSASPLVNASTWALMLTGRVLDDDPKRPAAALRGLVRRMGEPVVRTAVGQAMRMMGRQFVLGQTIGEAMREAKALERKGYSYSYDMLGEAARTDADARRYAAAYAEAIDAIAAAATGDVRDSPGISVKLSALHPRYEWTHRETVMTELLPRARGLARRAAKAGIGFNIDAEEQDRLDLSLDVIEALLDDPELAGWDGFGVVVQAYGKRAAAVIEWLDALAARLGRRIMVRLVKGAYWDTEIKLAQELGAEDFPVFTRKAATDANWLACAKMLLERRERLYPQFASHNAHSCAAVLEMAGNDRDGFEFQRLHGMGESLHELVREGEGTRCRIYAPVGAHRDLLAYLVRRLLENGANSSFVNQIVDETIPPERIAADPFAALPPPEDAPNPAIRPPRGLWGRERPAAVGVRPQEPASVRPVLAAREGFKARAWSARPLVTALDAPAGAARPVHEPADPGRAVGEVVEADETEARAAVDGALAAAPGWAGRPVTERAAALRRAADLYEAALPDFCALCAREAGKTLQDAVAELREAVDFLRYYANEAERLATEGEGEARGVFVCISPWNFPLAIFTGQTAAALAAGNAVVAKPAEQTPLIAARAVALLHEAGVDAGALQFVPGDGPRVGAVLTGDPRIAGVCFTGGTDTARAIHRALAEGAGPGAVLIAETGGLNAMVVDSTALTEQAVRDIVISAFQSAGQRCSALRILYVQAEARERLLEMLFGAMDALRLGEPWRLSTDVGPLIDDAAKAEIDAYLDAAGERVLKRLPSPGGRFVGPAVIEVPGIEAMEREIFGPVLHVASWRASELDAVVDAVNAAGYGLTFGLHSRIDDRVQQVWERLRVGNVYVNRNQIGAVVGSQPFGGEGLSGTGPKAGGPFYVRRFLRAPGPEVAGDWGAPAPEAAVQAAIDGLDARNWAARPDRIAVLRRALRAAPPAVRAAHLAAAAVEPGPISLPGPTGESNRLSRAARGVALCLGPGAEAATAQAVQALAAGCGAVIAAPGAEAAAAPLVEAGAPVATVEGAPAPEALRTLSGFGLVAVASADATARAMGEALAARDGPILTLETELLAPERHWIERHLCIDTTAAGGNAALLATVS
ncbi:MAG: bifunctional proline dehydrogenase/L-glutamate gamma-semialdehyde dehydrogenase PutA [Paracoccaceae bacterium]